MKRRRAWPVAVAVLAAWWTAAPAPVADARKGDAAERRAERAASREAAAAARKSAREAASLDRKRAGGGGSEDQGTAPAPPAQAPAAQAPAAQAPAAQVPAGETPEGPTRRQVVSLGEPDQRLFVVEAGGRWSMHAENLVTDLLFRLWHDAGGPAVATKIRIDRPFTISVHDLEPERIVERILDGYGYTLHYDTAGRLVLVRVYSPEPTQNFKTPRLVETLASWRDAESASEQANP